MGVYYTFEGYFTFDIPLPLSKIPSDSPHLPTLYPDDTLLFPVDLLFDLETDPDTGEVTAIALVPGHREPVKFPNIATEVRALLDAYGAEHPISGSITMCGDEAGAVTTVSVLGREVIEEDEEEEEEGEDEEEEEDDLGE
ncbi:hypothetical protein [Planomonospora sp. ID82291]|uniref:hypothetical protein n=1 Tax=Planomonospora sp. ID82291 TaxID=2738136 RepID=UPI0018C3E407|nr:hypothetical protein [Planomonospora sp. ID82291]MBG0818755.1 hypothetical protein [Planomonospora sp. ID82291]